MTTERKLTQAGIPMCPNCGAAQVLTCDDYYVHECTACGFTESTAQYHWGYYDNSTEITAERDALKAERDLLLAVVNEHRFDSMCDCGACVAHNLWKSKQRGDDA